MKRHSLSRWLCVVVLTGFTTLGCGPAGPGPSGTVKGTVTSNGKQGPGKIYFNTADGKSYQSAVGSDGTYKLTGQFEDKIPVGSYKVFVGPGAGSTDPTFSPPAGVKPEGSIPQKYLSADSSGWTAEVKEGDNTFDFKMD